MPLQDWQNMPDGVPFTMTTRDLPGVTLTMPQEDFDQLTDVLAAHYEAMSSNAAVNDAWMKYRMLLAMTKRS